MHDTSRRISRRLFLSTGFSGAVAGALLTSRSTCRAEDRFDLAELTVADLVDGMKAGKHTARSLAEKYLIRIEGVDRHGPTLRSVIELNPDAFGLAETLDGEWSNQKPRGPLHGIPVLIKDNIATADRMATTAGSLALVGAVAPGDAFVVAKLRRAGALVLGKTNLSEWANARSSHSTSGWSARGGQTRNPYALDRNPCGSSSGSAVAVAANLCAAAVGTETDGSVVAPASANGIVGIKPTVGLVSRSGIIPISHSQDTAGPMARTVRDAAVLLGVLAGADPEDKATAAGEGKAAADYTKFLDADGLKGARVGVARNYFGFHDGVDALMAGALQALKDQGATLVDTTGLPKQDAFAEAEVTVFYYEMKAGVNAYLARVTGSSPVHSLKDVIAFNEEHRAEEMLYFGQDMLVKTEGKGPLTSPEYKEALARCRRLARAEGIDAVMDKAKVDAIVAPTMGPACVTDLVAGDHWLGGDIISVAAVAGYPHVTVPAGFVFGLPVGLSFVGRPWSEPTLLRLAYAFEQATRARRPPRFLATAHLGAKKEKR